MEDRKLKEIEHSRIRRNLLKGFERSTETGELDGTLDSLVKGDAEEFKRHFANMKYYSITRSSESYKRSVLEKMIRPGVRVLDFACGNGENGLQAAALGGVVTGIDISPEGVDNANENARDLGLDSTCQFHVMDGENMTFSDNEFDFAVEYGALHHVDLDVAAKELARVMKPGGSMVCVEALRHNPIIHAYRKLTPHLRTAWEVDHILGVESVAVFEKYFHEVEIRFFHLFALLAVPFRRTFFFARLLSFLERVDDILLRNNKLGKYAWIAVIELRNPRGK